MNLTGIKEKIKKQEWVLGLLLMLGFFGGCLFLGIHESSSSPKPKQGWNKNYENKYFSDIYNQLLRQNKHSDSSTVEDLSHSIVDEIEYTYSVAQLPTVPNDTLKEVAYEESIVDDNDNDNQAIMAYTDLLILNIDLTK